MPFNPVYDSEFTPPKQGSSFNSSPWNLIAPEDQAPKLLIKPSKEQTSNIPVGESQYDTYSGDQRSIEDASYINQQRAANEPEYMKGINAVIGGLAKAAMTGLEVTGYLGDLANNAQRLVGLENVSSNSLSDMAKSIKVGIDEALPIYKKDPSSSWDWNDSASYWDGVKMTVDYGVGLALPGMGVGKIMKAGVEGIEALGAFSKVASGLSKVAQIAGETSKVGSLFDRAAVLTKLMGPDVVKTFGAGFVNNYAVGKMFALDIYNQSLQNSRTSYYDSLLKSNLEQGFEYPEAAARASKMYDDTIEEKDKQFKEVSGHHADSFQRENMVFALGEGFALGKLLKAKEGTRAIADKPLSFGQKLSSLSADNPLLHMVRGSTEMSSQMALMQEHQYEAAKETDAYTDPNIPKDFIPRMLHYGTDTGTVMMGVIGGFVGALQRRTMESLSGHSGSKYKEQQEQRYNDQQNEISRTQDYLKNTVAQYKTSDELMNEAQVKNMPEAEKYVEDTNMDAIFASNFAKGTTAQFEATLDGIAKMTPEEAKAEGYGDDYVRKALDIKKNLLNSEKEWIKGLDYENPGELFKNRQDRKKTLDLYEATDNRRIKAKSDLILATKSYKKYSKEPFDFSDAALLEGSISKDEELNKKLTSLPEYQEYKIHDANATLFENSIEKFDSKYTEFTSPKHQELIKETKKTVLQENANIAKKENEENAAKLKEERLAKAQAVKDKVNEVKKTVKAKFTKSPLEETTPTKDEVTNVGTKLPNSAFGFDAPPKEEIKNPEVVETLGEESTEAEINKQKEIDAIGINKPVEALNQPINKVDKETTQKDIVDNTTKFQKELDILNNPNFKNDKTRSDEWESTANELDEKLPNHLFTIMEDGKLVIADRQSYRGENFGGNKIVQVTNRSLHNQSEKFEEGDSLQIHNDTGVYPATVTKVNEHGKILEATSDEDSSRLLIKNGVILTSNEILKLKEINDKYSPTPDELHELGVEEDKEKLTIGTEYTNESDNVVDEASTHLDNTISEINGEKLTDSDGNVEMLYDRIVDGYNAVAYLSRNFVQKFRELFKGSGEVSRKDIDNVINEDMLDKSLLSNNKFTKGTKLVAKINLDNPIIYDPNSKTKETIEWNKFLEGKDAEFQKTDEYAEMVPISLFDESGKKVAHLHINDWLKEENIAGNIENNKAQLLAIRKAVIKNGELPITITEKRPGKLFRTFDGSKMILSKGMPDKGLTLAIGKDGKLFVERGTSGEFTHGVVNKKLNDGILYAVVPMGENNIAIPVSNIKLDRNPQVVNTVLKVLEAYSLWNRIPERQEEFKKLRDDIFNATGINISVPKGMRDYITNFVSSFNTNGVDLGKFSGLKDIKSDKYLVSINGGTFTYGRGKMASSVKFLRQETPIADVQAHLDNIKEHLSHMYSNISMDKLEGAKDKNVLLVNEDGTLTTQSYLDYIKNSTESNVISANIGTEEAPEYTYFVQPVIKFDAGIEVKPKETTEVKIEPTETTTETIEPTEVNPTYVRKGAKVIETGEGAEDFPMPKDLQDKLEEGSKDIYAKELGAVKQNALVAFVKGEVLRNLFIDGKAKQEELFANAKKIYEDLKAGTQEDIDYFTKSGETTELEQSKKALDEVNKVLKNWDIIERLAKEQIARINNVRIDLEDSTADVIESEQHEEAQRYGEDKSFTMDMGQKLSVELKRLFGNIIKTDKQGNKVVNYLGQEVTMPYDEVYNALQSITANQDPSFDTLISVMNSQSDSNKWLPQVIETLRKSPEDVQNMFVKGMTNHSHNMKFIMYARNNNGSYRMVEYDANANEISQIIRSNWKNKFENSTLLVPTIDKDGNLTSTGDKEQIDMITSLMDEWIGNISKGAPDKSKIKTWLNTIGIELTDEAIDKLVETKVNGNTFLGQFTNSNGLFKVLNEGLKGSVGTDFSNITLMSDSVIRKLSQLQSRYINTLISNTFRAGNKSIYSYGNSKFLVNEVRRIGQLNDSTYDGKPVKTSSKLTEYASTSFSKHTMLLNGDGVTKGTLLKGEDGSFIQAANGEYIVNEKSPYFVNFGHSVVSLDSIKEMGSNSKDNNELHQQSVMGIEIFKMAMLQAKKADASGNNKRIITITYPTTSDKTTVMMLNMAAFHAEYHPDSKLTDGTMDRLYDLLVLPELDRIVKHQVLRESNNLPDIKGYNEGAEKFLFFPEFNNIKDLFDAEGKIHPEVYNKESGFKEEFKRVLREQYIDKLVADKLETWDKLGIGKSGEINKQKIDNQFIDAEFLKGSTVDKEFATKYAATDMVVQYLVGNAEAFKLFITDPANYWKPSKSSTTISQQVEDTFNNIGKRLAADVAPGSELADSMNNNYIQIFAKDNKVASSQYNERLKKILSKEKLEKYNKASESTDAQEYTTWKEHLYVLAQQGLITPQEHSLLSEKLSDGKRLNHEELLKIFPDLRNDKDILTPIKPVYAGNVTDASHDVTNRVYIKSSSFPLLPQLTKGLELDKVRVSMEKLETDKGHTVRLAYSTAVKVGDIQNPVKVWDENGKVIEGLDFSNSYKILNRSGFRIQQDVPIHDGESFINAVTQANKNLFVNMMDVEGFKVPWGDKKEYTGRELQQVYNSLYGDLYKMGEDKLKKELLVEGTDNIDIDKFRKLVKEEAIKRSYGLSERMLIDLDKEMKFLPFSGIADKYSAILNALVYNRILKQKRPGGSFVLGSPTGFITDGNAQEVYIKDNPGIIFTSNWEGDKGVQTTREKDGKLLSSQVLVKWNFRDNEGNLLDINDFVDKKTGKIDFSKLPQELLKGFGMRIPNQGPNSQVAFEIVGFLPETSGDLIIASEDLVVQMGSDFDVDKLYSYTYNTRYNDKSGKLTKDSHTDEEIQSMYDKRNDPATEKLMKGMFGEEFDEAVKEDFADFRKRFDKKNIQNKLLDINLAIHDNNDKRVQSQIATPIDSGILEDEANFINKSRNERLINDTPFTGLSDAYQTKKFMQATAGKSGVGIFSSDSMFNVIAQTVAKLKLKDFQVTFGDKTSTGELNRSTTLGKDDLFISDVIAWYQSGAVDNEKLQIMDKLNVNDETFAFVKIMNQLGFVDETFLTLGQDIIFDYVNELKTIKGKLGDYTANALEQAYKNTTEQLKYKMIEEGSVKDEDKALTPEKLKDMIKNGEKSPDFKQLQHSLLNKFLMLTDESSKLTTLQQALNVDTRGFGKSIIESNLREEQFWKLVDSSVDGARNLVGDIKEISRKEIEAYENEGYTVRVRDDGSIYAIKPTTIPGHAITHGLFINNDLWNSVYPTGDIKVKNTFNELETILGREDRSFDNKSQSRFNIWKALKSFLFTSDNPIIVNPNERRRELLHDKSSVDKGIRIYEHKSLGTILSEMKEKKLFENNSFIQRLEIDGKNGNQIIKFNNSAREDMDESRLLVDFLDLFTKNRGLGEYNGLDYGTNKLASELVEYSYLTGGLQEAVQFTRLIPPMYLQGTGFMEHMGKIFDRSEENLGLSNVKDNYLSISKFAEQYVQHNPGLVPTRYDNFDKTSAKGKSPNNVDNFELTDSGDFRFYPGQETPVPPIFISVRNSSLPEKWQLYKYDGNRYNRMDVLGIPFSSEYNFNSEMQRSSFNKTFEPKPIKESVPTVAQEDKTIVNANPITTYAKLGITTTREGKAGVTKILTNISKEGGYMGILADEFMKAFEGVPKFRMELLSNPESKGMSRALGNWTHTKDNKDNVLYFNKKGEDYDTARVKALILHEIGHVLTVEEIEKYERGESNNKAIFRLKALHRQFTEHIKTLEGYDAYKQKYDLFDKSRKGDNEAEKLYLDNSFTEDEIATFYSGENLKEFVTQAMSSPKLQEILNNIIDERYSKDRPTTLWDSFKDSVRRLLSAIGIEINPHSMLASTFDGVMDLINKTPEEVKPIESIESLSNKEDLSQIGKILDGEVKETLLPDSRNNKKEDSKEVKELKRKLGYKDEVTTQEKINLSLRIKQYNAKNGTSHNYDPISYDGNRDLHTLKFIPSYSPVKEKVEKAKNYVPAPFSYEEYKAGTKKFEDVEDVKATMNLYPEKFIDAEDIPEVFVKKDGEVLAYGSAFASLEDAEKFYGEDLMPMSILGNNKLLKPKFQEIAEVEIKKASLLNNTINNLKVRRNASKDVVEKAELLHRITKLKSKVEETIGKRGDGTFKNKVDTILKLNALEDIEPIANEQLDEVERIFGQENVSPQEMEYAKMVVDRWTKAGDFSGRDHLFFDEQELEAADTDLIDIKNKFIGWREKANSIHRNYIIPNEEAILNGASTDLFGKTIDNFGEPQKDIGTVTSKILDISNVDNAILQTLAGLNKLANYHAHMEGSNINEGLDEILGKIKKIDWELFQQKFSNTDKNLTGDLVYRFTQEYFDGVREMFTDAKNTENPEVKNRKYNEAVHFLRENTLIFDVRKLFPNEELWGSKFTDAENVAHVEELKKTLGEVGYKEFYEKAKEGAEEYERNREAYKSFLEGEHGDNEKVIKAEMEHWEKSNSPAHEAKIIEEKGTKEKIAGKYVSPTGEFSVKVPKRFINGKETGYYDKNFEKIEADENLRELYNYVFKTINNLKQHLPQEQIKWMHINSLPNMGLTIKEEYMKDKVGALLKPLLDDFKRDTRVSDVASETKQAVNLTTGEVDKQLQTQFLVDHHKAIEDEINRRVLEFKQRTGNEPNSNEFKQIKRESSDRIARNKTFDLGKITRAYAHMALAYKHKAIIEDAMKAGQNIINRQDEIVKNNSGVTKTKFGEPIPNKVGLENTKKMLDSFMDTYWGYERDKPFGKTTSKVLTSKEKEIENRLNTIKTNNDKNFEDKLISEIEHTAINDLVEDQLNVLGGLRAYSKFGDSILHFIQLKGMGWNIFAGINNLTFGFISNIIEASDGRAYNNKDFWKATSMVLNSTLGYNKFNEKGRKISALMDKFDVLKKSQEELYKSTKIGASKATKKIGDILNPYNPQTSTEYINQATVMLAMMYHTEVKLNGKTTNLYEAFDAKGNLKEGVEFSGDYNLDKFKLGVDHIVAMNHGNYDPDMPIDIKRNLWGRALTQFKTWALQGFAERFMTEMPDVWLGYNRKGRYRSYASYYKTMQANGVSYMGATFNLTKQLLRKLSFGKYNTEFGNIEGFSEVDAANMRKNMTEIMAVTTLTALALMLRAAATDDKDSKTKYLSYFWLNQLNRANTDMQFYTSPMQFQQLQKNVIPAFSLVVDTQKALSASWNLIIGGKDEVKINGETHSKTLRAWTKTFPIVSIPQRMKGSGSVIYNNLPTSN